MAKWSEERKQRQAEAIRRWKPWEKSTGPKSKEGKERAAANSFGNGFHTQEWLALRKLMKLQRLYLDIIDADMRATKLRDAEVELLKAKEKYEVMRSKLLKGRK